MKLSLKLSILFSVSITGLLVFSLSASATDSIIPAWVKNNTKWWSEGSISEADYVQSLEYLINHGIINVPPTLVDVTAAKTSYLDEEHAQFFRVTISNIVKPLPIYYFEKFELTTSQASTSDLFGRTYTFRDTSPSFYLESLPSADKKEYYDFVADWMDRGDLLNKFDIDVDVMDGTGNVIQTWAFEKCAITSYGTYLQDVINIYQYSGIQDSEIRDRANFSCVGVSLETPNLK